MSKNKQAMTRIAAFIVDKRWLILGLFLAMIVFSVFSVRWIKVEEDITVYLPEEAEARQGLRIMEDEFTTYGTAQVMVKDITPEEAQALADELGQVEDVLLVQYDETANHYRDGKALYDITFADVTASERSEQALRAVRELLAERDTTIYTEVGFSLADILAEQMATVLVFVVIVVLAVLVFTSSTYAEVPVLILTFLTAAVVNLGTHFLLGTISFVSSSVAIVLQLALSVDYAIIFCNRYKEEHETLGVRDAVVKALAASIPEIFASSLTTIAGLTAMTFMKFRLGVDMGVCLIKAILSSLLTVFLFMPCLLMLFGKAMDKTKHRRFVPKIPFVGRLAYKTRFVFPILFVALVIGAYYIFNQTTYAYCVELVPAFRQTEQEAAQSEIYAEFGDRNIIAVLAPAGDYEAEKELISKLKASPEVKTVTGLSDIEIREGLSIGDSVTYPVFAELAGVDETTAKALYAYYAAAQGDHREAETDLENYQASLIDLFLFLHDKLEAGEFELPEDQAELVSELFEQLSLVRGQLMSDEHSRIVVDLNLPVQSERTFSFLDRIHAMGRELYGVEPVLTGNSVSALGFKDSFASDNMTVSLMSIVLVMLILFFTFRSFGMPLLLILVIQGSIWMNFAIATLRGNPIFFMCYLIVSAIQMGANIDYAIVVSSRYGELRQTLDRREAIIETMNLAFPTIITSGLMMVCAGLLIGFQVSQCVVAGMGYYVGTGTSISLVLILFALPQLLLLGDRFVETTRVRPENSAFYAFLVKHRRRIAAGALALAALFALIVVPFVLRSGSDYYRSASDYSSVLLEETDKLNEVALRVEEARGDGSLAYYFAEQLMTEEIGSVQLAEGEAQYEEGLAEYEAGKAQYDEGAAQLEDAEKQYNEGAAQLAAGESAYAAGMAQYQAGRAQYEAAQAQLAEGQAQYDAGQAEIEAARQQLAEGQAQYDAGQAEYEAGQAQLAAGQAQYNAAQAQYNAAAAALNAVAPLVDAAVDAINQAQSLQAEYDDAVARGDMISALAIGAALATAQMIADSQDLGGLYAQYQDAQNQLAAAEAELAAGQAELDAGYAQLAEAEAQLAAGKAQLDEGYAQLAAAEAELAAGKAQLDDGYAQLADAERQLAEADAQLAAARAELDAGYGQLEAGGQEIAAGKTQLSEAGSQLAEGKKELDSAQQQLQEGREQLDENREKLQGSIAALDELNDDEAYLNQGLSLLHEEKLLSSVPQSGSPSSYLNNVRARLIEFEESAMKVFRYTRFVGPCLGLAALLAALALAFLKKRPTLSAFFAALSSLAAAAALLFWLRRCQALSGWVLLPAAVLMVCAALFSEILFRQQREAAEGNG